MQVEFEIIIYISIWGIIGIILLFYILFPLKKIKTIEKTKSLYDILSTDELYKRLKQITVVYKYRSGWKQEKPISNNLKELESQFFSFSKKVSWRYYLKGTVKITGGNKSNNLFFIFDRSLDYKLIVGGMIGFYILCSIIMFFFGFWAVFFYYYTGPFLFFGFAALIQHLTQKQTEEDREKFMEELKEKILSKIE